MKNKIIGARKGLFFRPRLWALLMVGLILGSGLTLIVQNAIDTNQTDNYPLVAQRVLNGSTKKRIVNFSELRKKLNQYVNTNFTDSNQYSIYFEYLPTGSNIGLQEDNAVLGASLLKVPVAVQYYKAKEGQKIDPNAEITLKESDLDSTYGDLYQKGVGYTATLQDLVDIMIKNSDNTALNAVVRTLVDNTGLTSEKFFDFVDVDYQTNQNGRLFIGAQSYTSILKCVYFACDLSLEDSQQLLDKLTQTGFNDRLKRYINNPDLTVAHKIGSFGELSQSDCGIFYVPNKEYALCVMINGKDPLASQQIGQISVIVNEFINNIDSK